MLKQQSADNTAFGHSITQLSSPIAILFILAFSIPGICMTLATGWANWKTSQKIEWEPAMATPYFDVEQQSISYHYDYAGQEFTGLVDTGSKLSDKQNDQIREIKRQANRGNAIEVWTNPRQPEQSTVFLPAPTLERMFSGVFGISHGVLGLSLFAWALHTRRERSGHTDIDAMWRSDWRKSIARPSCMDTRWLFGTALAVYLITIAWTAQLMWKTDHPDKNIAALISMVGIIPLILLVRSWIVRQHNRSLVIRFEAPLDPGKSHRLTAIAESGGRPPSPRKWVLKNQQKVSDGRNISVKKLSKTEVDTLSQTVSEVTLEIHPPADGAAAEYCERGYGPEWVLVGGNFFTRVGPIKLPIGIQP